MTNNDELSSLEISSRGEADSIVGGTSWWQRHRSTMLTVGLFVILIATSLFSVLVYMLVRYLWLRLVRDPYLSPMDNLPSACWEMLTKCPPNHKRTLPTLLFFLGLGFALLGSARSKSAGYNSVEPDWLLFLSYQTFGSLLILCCAVWVVDAMHLFSKFCVGKNGEALDWWYRRRLNGYYKTNRRGYTTVAGGGFRDYGDENGSDHNEDDGGNNDYDGMEKEREKARYLDEERRTAKQRLVLIVLIYVCGTAWSAHAAFDPQLVELTIPIPKLPAACDGYRLAMASDLHAGSMSGVKDTAFMVENLNKLKPDAIALVGDIGDQTVNDALRQKLAPLANLAARDGVFYTFGNHENKRHIEDYRQLFRHEIPFSDKITLLENEHVILTRSGTDGCSILLLGMADWSGFGNIRKRSDGQVVPNLTQAMHTTPGPNGTSIHVEEAPSTELLPMIMMQHQPKNMTGAAESGVGLQLSGHTHGGQLFPQHVILFFYDAISGLFEYDVGKRYGPSYLFVSEGFVGWGPRLRWLSKTDYALLTLRSPASMKAEKLEPDTHMTLATGAMYFAFVAIPLSLLACLVPCCCWAKNGCKPYQPTLRDSGRREDTHLV